MANAFAVATVTECLRALIRDSAESAVPGAQVVAGPPEIETGEEGPRICVWLYSAAADAAGRNGRPSSSPAGEGPARTPGPRFGLSYMISFSGSARRLEGEILFGAAALALQDRPLLDPATIAHAAATRPGLAGSDLAEAPEPIAIRLADPGEEAIGRLWASLPGVARRLSLFCTVGPVILDSAPLPLQPRA